MKNIVKIAIITIFFVAATGCGIVNGAIDGAIDGAKADYNSATNAFSSKTASKEATDAATAFGQVVYSHAKEKGAKKSLNVINAGNKTFNQYAYLPTQMSEMTTEQKAAFFDAAEAYAKKGDARLMKGGKSYNVAKNFLKHIDELRASEGIVEKKTEEPKVKTPAKGTNTLSIDVSKLSKEERTTLMSKIINGELNLSEEQNNALMAELLK